MDELGGGKIGGRTGFYTVGASANLYMPRDKQV